uniref:Zinc finger HIT domain-containing protein 3 n=1 Tax=Simocephalus serrulatus TaxID=117539 RepID=A0A4Y7NRD4_9CRUS|nr:EOG090X0JQ4 [Simocephalus serrulatus]SVE94635.1 EOG090X0JQ4 [Simocephalus serrulatus]
MTVSCQICQTTSFKYKCPTCYIKYCSLQCFKVHKESPCEKPTTPPLQENLPVEAVPLSYKFPTSDTVPIDKLQELANSEELKECLSNPHVREILKSLVQSQTPETAIQDAMKEPIFLETAHACLKVVEPEKFQPELTTRSGFTYDDGFWRRTYSIQKKHARHRRSFDFVLFYGYSAPSVLVSV